jgi:hypothetical protein
MAMAISFSRASPSFARRCSLVHTQFEGRDAMPDWRPGRRPGSHFYNRGAFARRIGLDANDGDPMTMLRLARYGSRLTALSLLALAAASSQAQGRFTVSADGQEVTDSATHLTWRRCAEGLAWDGKTCAGKLARYKYGAAKVAASGVGKGWRIPSRQELVGLVDMQRKKPSIDPVAFPGTPAMMFWATKEGSTDDLNAWLVSFANGKVQANLGEAKFPLRLVRTAS